MNLVREGNHVYSIEQIGSSTIKSSYDHYFNTTIDYIDSVLYVTIKNYLGEVINTYNGDVTLIVNGTPHTITVTDGVGTFAIVSDYLRVKTDIADIRNGEYAIGADLTPEDRIDELERAQADLIITLVEKGVL